MPSVHLLASAECGARERARCMELLGDDERERVNHFVFPEHGTAYALAHGMLRLLLAEQLGITPDAVRFDIGSHGKPSVQGCEFNLSHSDGLIAVAIGAYPLGVDVEWTARSTDFLAVCDRFFAASEAAALRALPARAQRERFFRYWTLKEAYIKARGMGLAIPLAGFCFAFADGDIRLHTEPSVNDDPARWRFEQHTLGAHMLATCVDIREAAVVRRDFAF